MAKSIHVNSRDKSQRDQRSPKRTKLALKKMKSEYWAGRLYQKDENGVYFIRLGIHGERHEVCLETQDKVVAASRTLDLYKLIVDNDWIRGRKLLEAMLLGHARSLGQCATIKEIADSYLRAGSGSFGTRNSAVSNLYNLASSVKGIDRPDYNKDIEAYHRWKSNIGAMALSSISEEEFQNWRLKAELGQVLDSRTGEPLTLATIDKSLREYRAIFGKRSIAALKKLVLPEIVPGVDLPFFNPQAAGFVECISSKLLLEHATTELFPKQPELFKALLLALCLGLRRGEIDRLTWSAFNFEEHTIKLAPETLRRLKWASAKGVLPVSPELNAFFKKIRGNARKDEYVVRRPRGRNVANKKLDELADRSGSNGYRANSVFKRLILWLREHSVEARTPIHYLRKAFGWDICVQKGIYEASKALRHSNVRTTEISYMSKKVETTSSLSGQLLGLTLNGAAGDETQKAAEPAEDNETREPDEGKIVPFELPRHASKRKVQGPRGFADKADGEHPFTK